MPPRLITASPLRAAHRLVSIWLAAVVTSVAAAGCPSEADKAPAPVVEPTKNAGRQGPAKVAERPARTRTTPKADTAGTVMDLTATTNAGLATTPEPHANPAIPSADPGSIDGDGQRDAPVVPADPAAVAAPEAESPADKTPLASSEAPPSPPTPSPAAPAAAPPPAPTLDPATCRAACDNALSVTLAELPDTTAPSMREELKRVLDTECPSRCLAKASVESAQCIANARSALALASCP